MSEVLGAFSNRDFPSTSGESGGGASKSSGSNLDRLEGLLGLPDQEFIVGSLPLAVECFYLITVGFSNSMIHHARVLPFKLFFFYYNFKLAKK